MFSLDQPRRPQSVEGEATAPQDFVAEWREVDHADIIKRLIRAVWHRRALVFGITFAAALLATIVSFQIPKTYEAYAQLAVLQQEADPLRPEITYEARFDDPVTIESEVRILQTREVFEEVVARLNLLEDQRFLPEPSGLAALFQRRSQPDAGGVDQERLNIATRALHDSLEVTHLGQSRVIELVVASRDPHLSAAIANTLMDVHIERQIARRREQLEATLAALSQRRDALNGDVRRLDGLLNAFLLEKAQLHDRDARALDPLLQSVEAEVVAARGALDAADAEYAALQEALERDESAPAFAESELIETLSASLAEREAALAELSAQYGPRHPQFVSAQAAVAELQGSLDSAKRAIVSSREVAVRLARSRLETALSARDDLRRRMSAIAVTGSDRAAIEREREDALTILSTISRRLDRTREEMEVLLANVEIVGHASAPFEPAGPSKKLIVVGGAFVGGVVALLLALGLEWTDPLVRRPDHLDDLADANVVALPPSTSKFAPQDEVIEQPGSLFSARARHYGASAIAIRNTLEELRRGACFAVTSSSDQEGCTAVSLTLARALAAEDQNVLVVEGASDGGTRLAEAAGCAPPVVVTGPGDEDGDERGTFRAVPPSNVTHLGAGAGPMPLERLVERDKYDLLDVFGASTENLKILKTDSFGWDVLVNQALEQYDCVIINAPNVLDAPDRYSLMTLAHALCLVVNPGVTRVKSLRSAHVLLQSLPARALDVVYHG